MSLESLNGFEYLANFIKVGGECVKPTQFRVHGFKEKNDGNYYYQLQAIFSMEGKTPNDDVYVKTHQGSRILSAPLLDAWSSSLHYRNSAPICLTSPPAAYSGSSRQQPKPNAGGSNWRNGSMPSFGGAMCLEPGVFRNSGILRHCSNSDLGSTRLAAHSNSHRTTYSQYRISTTKLTLNCVSYSQQMTALRARCQGS
jgi:hypothetical protein